LPESAEPIVPKRWGELNTVTIAFGHGLSVAPLQSVMGVAAILNGGYLIPPTFLKRSQAEARAIAKRVVKPETSSAMRYLMRLNAEKGTATKADVKGFYVGGKTGTAEKVINGRYSKNRLMTDFMAVLPADDPRFLVLIMLDEPQAIAETHGFATSGWNAAPVTAKVIERIAPLLGIEPRFLVLIMLDEPKPLAETHGFATSGWNAAPVTAKVITRIAPLLGLEPRFDLPQADHLILAAAKEAR